MTVYSVLTAISFSATSSAPTPLYHLYQESMRLTPLVVTVIFASYCFSLLAGLLTVASLSDHVGRRPMILAALLVNAVALGLFVVATSPGLLILARMVQGVAVGIGMTTLGAAILDTDRRNGAIYNSVTAFLGLMVGVLAAGGLVAFAPLPTQMIYLVLLALTLIEAAILPAMPETTAGRSGALASLRPRVRVPAAARPILLRLLPLNIAGWALGGFYMSLMPTLVTLATGIASPFVGAVVVSALMLTASVAIIALRQRAAERLLTVAMQGLGLGIALTLAGTALHSVGAMAAGTVIAGIGFGASFSANLRMLLPLAPETERAGLLAAYFVESYLALGVPVVAAGLAAPVLGLVTTSYLYGSAQIGFVLLSAVATRRARPAAEAGRG